MAKINQDHLKNCIAEMNQEARDKKRKFPETVDLLIGLKDYDPQKDKRFAGNVKLPVCPRPRMKVCILGDQVHCDQAAALGIPHIDAEGLQKFQKNRKTIKRYFKSYRVLLASDGIIKQLPRLVGPSLTKLNKFPMSVSHNDNLQDKITEAQSAIKFQLKKVLCLGVAVANVQMSEEEQRANITLAMNFLVSLLKKNWNNLKTVHIKTTMGKAKRIYG